MSTPRRFHVRSAEDLGTAIKYFRKQAGISQAVLADRTGIHRSYLVALENGQVVTEAVERIMLLLQELGLDVTITSGQ